MTRALNLSLTEPERTCAARLAGEWSDLLYAPGPGFSSPIDPGLHTSSFIIVPAGGPLVRASSIVVPALGGELCRLRLELLPGHPSEVLGSFFDPMRRGFVYALSGDRRTGGARPPDQPGWSYDGRSLAQRLGTVTRVQILRERVTGGRGDGSFSWAADRGLVLQGVDGEPVMLLSRPDVSEHAVLVLALGLYRALLDPSAPEMPGASRAELLGYGDWEPPLEVAVELETLPRADRAASTPAV